MRIRFFSSVTLQAAATIFVIAAATLIFFHFGVSPDFNPGLKKSGKTLQTAPLPAGTWRFIVSGDSRNCGDVVMPSIAADSARFAPSFYWHLGDLRAIYKTDEDMEAVSAKNGQILACGDYYRRAWPDFIENQIAPFAGTPFYVGIGNHETILPKDEAQFTQQFSAWLSTPTLNAQRQQDEDKDPASPRPYYHWIQGGVDFIYLDNAKNSSFSEDQLAWFDRIIAKDQANNSVLSFMVGMHEALPDSIASSHAMCDKPNNDSEGKKSCESGRHVYQALLALQRKKPVYVLASHSHFYMTGVFDNHPPDERLPGWIVGTAGAVRYKLPPNPPATAKTDVYGYLLGTVDRDGKIQFEFQQIKETEVPEQVRQHYPPWLVPWCFAHNSQNIDPIAEETTHLCTPAASSQ
jgi:hypothetical protein